LSIRALAGRCGYSHGSIGNFLNEKASALPDDEAKTRRMLDVMGATPAEIDTFIRGLHRVKEAERVAKEGTETPVTPPMPSRSDMTTPTADLDGTPATTSISGTWTASALVRVGVMFIAIVAVVAVWFLTRDSLIRYGVSDTTAQPSPPFVSATQSGATENQGGALLIAADGRCVHARDGSTGYDTPIVLGRCTHPNNQRWRLLPVRANEYRLVNNQGRCLGAHDIPNFYQGTKQNRTECLHNTHYVWRITKLREQNGSWEVTLFNVGRAGCLQALPNGVVELTALCSTHAAQVFRVSPVAPTR